MGLLKDFIEKYKAKKEEFEIAERQQKIGRVLEQRQKSANERELESYMEEERQRKIDIAVKRIREQKNHKMWKENYFKPKKGKGFCGGKVNLGTQHL